MTKKILIRLATIIILLVIVLGFSLRSQASKASSPQQDIGNIVFTPVADSFVRESNPESNYGSSKTLYVDNYPVTHSYLRFEVNGLTNQDVQSVKFRIYANSSNRTGFTVSAVLDNNWEENEITYNNAPEIGPEIGISRAIKSGRWVIVDVTNAIQSDGIYTLEITTSSSRNTNLSSREAGNKAPQLVFSSNIPPTLVGEVPTETPLPEIPSETPVLEIPSDTPTESFPSSTPDPGTAVPSDVPTKLPAPTTEMTMTNTPTVFIANTATSNPTNTPTVFALPTDTPTSNGDPVLVGAGDISSCSGSGDEATAKLIDGIAGVVFTAGDNAYESGSTSEYTNCYNPTWGRFKDRTNPSPGNHEYNTSGATGYYGYFGAAAGDPSKGYYSYNLGSWHIVVLNSEISTATGSAQEKWLRQDLIDNQTTCTLAYWHEPRFSSGSTHGSSSAVQPLWQALYDYHADVIVNGHEHNYERFAPQSPSGAADVNGLMEFVAGMGGRSHYGFGSILANSLARNGDTYGVLKFTLHSTSYDWQFVPEAGKTYADSGTASCVP
jgi:acid phosphatase type 7